MKKTIVVGVSGGIAAFKSVQLVSDLVKMNYDVEVIMTKNACEFIQPLSFEALTQHTVMVDTFDHRFERSTKHISIAKKADCFIIAPATANVIAKIANGLADDMLSTTFLACRCPKLIAPAMNTNMYENPITQDNLRKCAHYGIEIIDSASGFLACGDVGKGKMADIETLKQAIHKALYQTNELKDKKVVVTAGATMEALDPVRFITNHSSGKMGIALAKAASLMGADVTLICGNTTVEKPADIHCIEALSAAQMASAVKDVFNECDILIKAAAVADYRPKTVSSEKMKKSEADLSIEMERTEDILAWCGKHKTHQVLVGFAMETQNLLENATDKLKRKNCDMLVANSLRTKGAGFKGDTNVVTLLTPDTCEELELMSKDDVAKIILERTLLLLEEKESC